MEFVRGCEQCAVGRREYPRLYIASSLVSHVVMFRHCRSARVRMYKVVCMEVPPRYNQGTTRSVRPLVLGGDNITARRKY